MRATQLKRNIVGPTNNTRPLASPTMAKSLRDIAEFTSRKFAPFLPDEAQVNPGVYGAELAFWLAERLADLGIVTSYPQNEDWGWYLEYLLPSGSEFAVHCSNTSGATDTWQLHLFRQGRKLFGRDPPPFGEARPLVDAIRRTLEAEADLVNLQWLYPAPDDD
jgi:hypothetical protein